VATCACASAARHALVQMTYPVQGRSYRHNQPDSNVSKVRFLLVTLICASPVLLLTEGLIINGLLAGIVAAAMLIISQSLRPAETEFFVSIIRTPLIVAAVPVLWILIQTLPFGVYAHPIWKSAETALHHPVIGAISVDPGASVIALGQYLSVSAVTFVSAAVAVDRQRAEWILFALTAASAAIALIPLAHDLFLSNIALASFTREQAIDCAGMGAIIASAACIRTFERYETRHSNPQRSVLILRWTFAASFAAMVICTAALTRDATTEALASGCGLSVLFWVFFIRSYELGLFTRILLPVFALAAAILLLGDHLPEGGRSMLLAFAAEPSASATSLSERVLDDAPLVGTGAGTFAALARIYREMNDPPAGPVAATAAAGFAIELGRPMLWFIAAATAGFLLPLLRASRQRGRDWFYPAIGASCLITLALLAFVNSGLLGAATGLIAASALGLALAQSKSRTIRL